MSEQNNGPSDALIDLTARLICMVNATVNLHQKHENYCRECLQTWPCRTMAGIAEHSKQ